jgi:TolB-like protein
VSIKCLRRSAFPLFLGLVAVYAAGGQAQEAPRENAMSRLPAKIILKDGSVCVAEIVEETPEQVKVVDIKTGIAQTFAADTIVRLKRDIGEPEAINWTGLTPYLAWRVQQAQKVTASGQVVTVTPTAVYVNLGERDGVEKGDRLKVYRQGEALTDPQTGEALGVIRSLVAELEVTEVQEKLSKARRTTDIETELQRGDVVDLEWSRRAVAVLPISAPREEYNDLARSVREEWTTALVARGVPVVERAQVDKVLAELGVQQSVLVDAQTTSRLGEMAGAYAVLVGSITPAGYRVEVHARLVKVRTGKALLAASSDVDQSSLHPAELLQQASSRVAPVRDTVPRQGAPHPAPVPENGWQVVEGSGWRAARLGATKEEVIAAFGRPEDNESYWLNYRTSLGVDVFYGDGDTAREIRFNPGFRGALRSGIGIGSRMDSVFAACGRPLQEVQVQEKPRGSADRVLYRRQGSAKLTYRQQGVLFWFDSSDKVSQFVVFPPD